MVILEALIFFIGIGSMYYQQKRTADLMDKILHEPDIAAEVANNLLFGVMQDIAHDEEKQQIFFSFVQNCGISAYNGLRHYLGENPPSTNGIPEGALKGIPKPLKGILRFADAAGIDLKGIAQKHVNKTTEAALEGW